MSKSKTKKHDNGIKPNAEQEDYFRQLAPDVWEKTWDILTTSTGWIEETKNHDLNDGVIYSQRFQHLPHNRKLFKMEGYVDASAQAVFEELVIKIEETPKWNPTVQECVTVQVIDENTDISHNMCNPTVGGIISSRDFVNLRHWKARQDVILSAGCSVQHPTVPSTKKFVRGENGPGGWYFKSLPDNPDKCIFGWIFNTDIKGWIPQYLVEQAITGTLLYFLKNVRIRMEELRDSQ